MPLQKFPQQTPAGWHLTSYGLGQERFARSWWSHQPQKGPKVSWRESPKPQQPKIGYVPTHEAHRELLKEKIWRHLWFFRKKTTAKNH